MKVKVLTVGVDVLGRNEENARLNRQQFDAHSIFCINIMSSPGAGKTSLIQQTIRHFTGKVSLGVIEGDIASSVDADKISREGVPVVQINTAGACHLEANMVARALENLPLDKIDLLIIENVGNLICTAEFALGEHKRVMLLSTPEGDDKPLKYPLMFTEADVVLINKIDLLPYVDFNIGAFTRVVAGLNPDVTILKTSGKTGEGLERWFDWLEKQLGKAAGHPSHG